MFPRKIITLSLTCLILITGCSLLPSPDKTITPPREKPNISVGNKDLNSIVKGFLSKTASLEPVQGSSDAIRLLDVDGDKTDEILFTYKDIENNAASGIKILKKNGEKWSEYFKQEYINGPLKSVDLQDVTGDNVSEIFIINNSSFSLISKRSDKWDSFTPFSSPATYEIKDIGGVEGGDGMIEIIVREELYNDFRVRVLRWEGYGFIDVEEEYPEIYNEEITFYQALLKDSPEKTEYWIRLIDSQKKAGKYDDALRTVENCMKLYNSNNTKKQFMYLKGEILFLMGNYKEALDVYAFLKRDSEKNGDNSAYFGDLTFNILTAQKEYDKAREYCKSSSSFPYDTNLQTLDSTIAGDKIREYIKGKGIQNLDRTADELGEWGKRNGIIIDSIKTEYSDDTLPRVLVLDYHISPEKAYGKDNVGAHVIYWVQSGELHERVFSLIGNVSDHHLVAGLKARKVEAYMDGNYFKIRVNYENTVSVVWLPNKFDQVFMIQNNKLKFAWK